MGYLIQYKLIACPQAIIKELWNFSEKAKCALDENGYSTEATKWYNHEDELCVFSKSCNATIILEGYGEEFGDYWCKRFVDGYCAEESARDVLIELVSQRGKRYEERSTRYLNDTSNLHT